MKYILDYYILPSQLVKGDTMKEKIGNFSVDPESKYSTVS
jgi:hypothetical protein